MNKFQVTEEDKIEFPFTGIDENGEVNMTPFDELGNEPDSLPPMESERRDVAETETGAGAGSVLALARHLYQQIEFMMGRRSRGWDIQFLKERLDAAAARASMGETK